MNRRPAVTVGLPFFNSARTLRAAIASVFNQTLADWELILVDDGSTDGSRAVAEAALADGRVQLLSDGVNRGISRRLNELAVLARAPVLARMDADDVMHPERLARQLEHLGATGADVAGTSVYVMDEDLRVRGLRRNQPCRSEADVLRGCGFIHPSCIGRTAWWRANPYEESWRRGEDVELWLRTVSSSHFAWLDEPLLFYRESSRPNLKSYRASWQMTRHLLLLRGPAALGLLETGLRVARTYAARVAYGLAAGSPRWTESLLARRSAPISELERGKAEEILRQAIRDPAAAAQSGAGSG